MPQRPWESPFDSIPIEILDRNEFSPIEKYRTLLVALKWGYEDASNTFKQKDNIAKTACLHIDFLAGLPKTVNCRTGSASGSMVSILWDLKAHWTMNCIVKQKLFYDTTAVSSTFFKD
mmetsp:Transcript_17678/g.27065  ORF Transcript_17678/g.27065 Transcript_17678/m.27065 type:complete len:118 (-) Transcript_17678:32-385(-)